MAGPSIDHDSVPAAATGGIVLFDGRCNLCNGTVNFLLARDSRAWLKFAALDSEAGRRLLAGHGLEADAEPGSFVYIENDRAWTRSDAALAVARRLDGPWPWLTVFRIVPRFLRDAVYGLVARNRYRWFGRTETCRVPTPDLRRRFLED